MSKSDQFRQFWVPAAVGPSWDLSGAFSPSQAFYGNLAMSPERSVAGQGPGPQNDPKWPKRPDPQILTPGTKNLTADKNCKIWPSPGKISNFWISVSL